MCENPQSGTQGAPQPVQPVPPPANPLAVIQQQLGGPLFIIWGVLSTDLVEACVEFVDTQPRPDKMNVLIDTFGGSPDIAFSSAVTLRGHCNRIAVHIARKAKSAGSLFCLGGDEIVMHTGAELGPLDMQVTDPRVSTEWISALSGKGALNAVATFLHDEFDLFSKQFIYRAGTNIADACSYAIQIMTSIARPLFEQVNPLELGKFGNSLLVNQMYAKELLKRAGVEDRTAHKIAESLVVNYPSHTFVIDKVEAERVGLRVRHPNADETAAIRLSYRVLKQSTGTNSYFGLLPV